MLIFAEKLPMNKTSRAHLFLIVSGLLFGANYWIAKGLMPDFMQPAQIILVRCLSAVALFWLVSMMTIREKVGRRDHILLAMGGLTGISVNQTFFFSGLALTSPVDAALLHSGSPIVVLLFSALIAGEKINLLKISGILMGASGAVALVLQGSMAEGSSGNQLLGNSLIVLNIVSYSLYLVIIKPLMSRYTAITIMKWVFLYGFLFVIPYSLTSVSSIQFGNFTGFAWFSLAYIVIGTTFVTYLMTSYSLRYVSAGTAGYYIYIQPVIAAFIGIVLFRESFTLIKLLAAVLVFAGVFLVNRNTGSKKMSERNQ